MAIQHDSHARRIKKLGYYANYALSVIVVVLLVAAIIYWIYQEVVGRDLYVSNLFLDGDPKFREARTILLIGYLLTLAFLAMIQCCIQIAKDPQNQHIGPRRIVWCLASTLTILVFITAAALAASFKGSSLVLLEDNMKHDIQHEDFYSNFSAGEFSETGEHFNLVQSKLECCGVDGPSDYSAFAAKYNMSLPYSCCELKDVTSCQNGSAYDVGCYDILARGSASMCQEVVILGSVCAVGLFIITLLRLVLGYYYQRHKEKRQYEAVEALAVRKNGGDQQTTDI